MGLWFCLLFVLGRDTWGHPIQNGVVLFALLGTMRVVLHGSCRWDGGWVGVW